MRKAGIGLAMLAWGIAADVIAQTPAPLPNPPNLSLVTNGWVKAMVRQADGGTIIGGSFTSVNGFGRGNLARLMPDGSLDPAWNPSANDEVRSLAVDPASGAVYAGGYFSVIGARNRAHIARLSGSGTGAVDATWNPSADGGVYALAVNNAGDVYACGYFSNAGGQARKVFAKLSGTGTGAAFAAWNAATVGNYCNAMALDSNGDLFVSGDFTSIGGQSRPGLAKLTSAGNGAADATWNPNPADGPYAPYVAALATDGAGALYASGNFTSIGGQTRDGLAKLSTGGSGAADATWNPGNCCVYGVHVGADGKIYVGGGFASVGGSGHPRLARLSPSGTGAADSGWNPTIDSAYGASFKLLADASGKVRIASFFSGISGQRRLSLTQVDATGVVIGPVTDVEAPGKVKAVARQPGGGLVVGGEFMRAVGLRRDNLLRLNADGSLDAQWAPLETSPVNAIAVDPANGDVYAAYLRIDKFAGNGTGAAYTAPDWYLSWNSGIEILAMATDSLGRLYVGGDFYQVNGVSRSNLVRLSPDDTVDPTWNPAPTGIVRALALDGSGNLVVGGNFTYIGGAWRDYIARVSTTSGAADPGWNPSANSAVLALAIDGSGDVFAGGSFNYIGGATRCKLARLAAGTGLALPGWAPGTGCSLVSVSALALDGNGALYANGSFTGAGGVAVSDLARFSANGGTLDVAWKPAPDAAVNALAIDAAGHVVAGGTFSRIGGQLRSALAILPGDGDVIFSNGFQ